MQKFSKLRIKGDSLPVHQSLSSNHALLRTRQLQLVFGVVIDSLWLFDDKPKCLFILNKLWSFNWKTFSITGDWTRAFPMNFALRWLLRLITTSTAPYITSFPFTSHQKSLNPEACHNLRPVLKCAQARLASDDCFDKIRKITFVWHQ